MQRPLWFWTCGWFVTVVAIAGNALVIYLLATKPHLQRTTNWFILSLAVADFFVGVSYIPPLHACEEWFSCSAKIWSLRKSTQWFFLYSSISNLVILTMDRYIAITLPLRHKSAMTPSRIALLVCTAWAIPFTARVCIYSIVYLHSKAAAYTYLIPMFLVMFELLPCVLLPCLTVRMVYIARRCRRRAHQRVEDSTHELRSPVIRIHLNRQSRGTGSVGVIMCVVSLMILCYSLELYSSICYVFELCSLSTRMWNVRHILMVANSAVNPLAYALFKRDIKGAILKIACLRSNVMVSPASVH